MPEERDEPDPALLNLDILVRDEAWDSVIANISGVCGETAKVAFSAGISDPVAAEAALVLADDAFVAALNQEYRNKSGPTNVLSFAALDGDDTHPGGGDGAPLMLGDIIIARETTEREALETGISVEHHLRHLVVHGILHLLGYDHLEEDDAEEMETLEIQVLAGMGVADPYGVDLGDVGQTEGGSS